VAGDRVEDHVQVATDLNVPKAQDRPTVGFEPAIPNLVVSIFAVLFAVTFDNYPMREAGEVDDVSSDDDLPSKVTHKLTST
jgi:hypothetical protein